MSKRGGIFIFIMLLLAGLLFYPQITGRTLDGGRIIKPLPKLDPKQRGGIIYGVNNSYRLVAPEGWVIDTQAGQKDGYSAVFFDKDSHWQYAEASVYTIAIAKDGHSFQQVMADNLRWFQSQLPKIHISDWGSMPTEEGPEAIVKMLDGDPESDIEMVAYIDAPNTVTTIVFAANDEENFNKGYPFFEGIVKSYKYITSDVQVERGGKPAIPAAPAADEEEN